ncbi:MAG: hypothetical protein JW881_20320 [Spirochaetales bacterium]|nr:hypothetical protein [Spirochaetales bacterium]
MKKNYVKEKSLLLIGFICAMTANAGFAAVTGDVNGDGEVNIVDALQVAQHYVGLNVSGFDTTAADVDCSQSITITDALLIARYYVGLIDSFPCGQTGEGTLPPVNSVETDGPFPVTIDKNTGPSGNAWIVRPSSLGSNGLNRHPVFLWGPGAGSDASWYETILRRIASHGFVVYSEESTGNGTEMIAAMDWLAAQNGNSGSTYYRKLNTDKIAAGGHSMGSLTTFGCADDPRLTTTIHVAGGSFDGNGPSRLRNPAAYMVGLDDTLSLSNTRNDYENTTVPVWLGEMTGVEHGGAPQQALPAVIAWLRWYLGGETSRKDMFMGSNGDFTRGIWQAKYKNW